MTRNIGRAVAGRVGYESAYCQSCRVRLTIGDPRPTAYWPSRLRLERDQLDSLLTAAADYRDLCAEAGEYESAVEFTDWIAGVARQDGQHVDHDGAPPRNESGTLSEQRQGPHRHPDPIPVVSLPRSVKVAS